MKKTMMLGAISILMSVGSLAHAESYYRTFSDSQNKVTLSISNQRAVVDSNGKVTGTNFDPHISEVTLNGKELSESEVSVSVWNIKRDEISVNSASYGEVLVIPAHYQAEKWNHKKSGQFSNGDSRLIRGNFIINGTSVNELLETYDSE